MKNGPITGTTERPDCSMAPNVRGVRFMTTGLTSALEVERHSRSRRGVYPYARCSSAPHTRRHGAESSGENAFRHGRTVAFECLKWSIRASQMFRRTVGSPGDAELRFVGAAGRVVELPISCRQGGATRDFQHKPLALQGPGATRNGFGTRGMPRGASASVDLVTSRRVQGQRPGQPHVGAATLVDTRCCVRAPRTRCRPRIARP